MYIRTGTGLGQARPTVELGRAIRLNRYYARSLGWKAHQSRIAQLLGLEGTAPDEREFARRVARWQQDHALGIDGVIGPDTWGRIRADLSGARGQGTPSTPSRPPISAGGVATAAPGLRRREDYPRTVSLYVEIDLHIADNSGRRLAEPMTGIFIPENYAVHPEVDLILYLHGHKKDAHGHWYPDLTIDQYWSGSRFPSHYFPLREGLNAGRKNAILVAPTLGPRSQAGRLVTPPGLSAYVDQLLAALGAYEPYRKAGRAPVLGNLILAAHSGGGKPMRQIALMRHPYASRICECWGFDCHYDSGDPETWLQWAGDHPNSKLYTFYWGEGTTKKLACLLDERARRQHTGNVQVGRSDAANHFMVPARHWVDRIQNAKCFRDT